MGNILVLGGTGTIGHQLCRRLVEDGHWVRCVDRKQPEFSPCIANELIIGDLRDVGFVSKVMFHSSTKTFNEVYMLAAEMGGAGYVFSGENDAEIMHNSMLMNLHVADQAAKKKVVKLFYSSSACCYPERLQTNAGGVSLKESDAWDGKPDSAYGVEKLVSEQIYDAYCRNHGLDIRIGRFHNIFSEEGVYAGGREKAPAAICRKVAEAEDGGEIEIWGSGEYTRSFLYCQEALDGVRKLMDSHYQFPVNIGSSELISINDLARMVIEISGKKLYIVNTRSSTLGVAGRNSDNTMINYVTGWQPTEPLRTGM